jgi:Nif-specific regulatory protein
MSELPIRNETNELRLLFEVSQALEGPSALADHLETALELMARYTGMMRGALWLVGPEGDDIALEASYGLKHSEKRRAHYKMGEGVTGKVIATGKPVVVPNVSKEPLFLNRTGARDLQKEEIAFICVPITLGGETVGALSADRLFADSVCLEEDMRLLQVLSSLIARAVRSRREIKAMHAAVVEENRRLQKLVNGSFYLGDMVGESASFQPVLRELVLVTSSNATVLIRGESGTGKELIAGIIHANSERAGRPFIKVNCAAMPDGLVESEFFGHERGAFTGAVGVRKGRFEMAHGGTLFLDEVGDMTPLAQSKLLRVLQEKEFERVGGTETLRVDVRLIAATSRPLESMVAEGAFRQDLYYRLNVFPLTIPPLRERRDDIMPLAMHFVRKLSARNKRAVESISPRAGGMLMDYEWPGNIRELENVIERAVILCGAGGVIGPECLPLWVREAQPSGASTLDEALAVLEERLIRNALESTRGNMARAAERLGITERIMGLRMKKYNFDFRDFRKGEEKMNAG